MCKKDEFYLFTMECMEMVAGVSAVTESASFSSIVDMKIKEAKVEKMKVIESNNEI